MVRGLSRIISPEGFVYGGLDESNHGHFPEYFSLVLSGKSEDIVKSLSMGKAKTEANLDEIFRRVLQRGHTFLQVEKRDYNNIAPNKFLASVATSLTEDFLPEDLDTFHLFIDGKLNSSQKFYIRGLLAEVHHLSKNQIKVEGGGKYDKKYPIVNMADGVARYYFRKKFSAQQLSRNSHRRELQYFN